MAYSTSNTVITTERRIMNENKTLYLGGGEKIVHIFGPGCKVFGNI